MVLAHISARWPEKELLENYFGNNHDFQFHIYDSVLPKKLAESYEDLVDFWKLFVRENNYRFFMGISFGGCILQKVLGDIGEGEKLVCVSSPAFLNEDLRKNIVKIRQFFCEGLYVAGLEKLYFLIGNEDVDLPAIQNSIKGIDPDRFIRGFDWILQHDGRTSLDSGKFLCLSLFGCHSRLVKGDHGYETKCSSVRVIEHSGMRILSEDHERTMENINKFYLGDVLE